MVVVKWKVYKEKTTSISESQKITIHRLQAASMSAITKANYNRNDTFFAYNILRYYFSMLEARDAPQNLHHESLGKSESSLVCVFKFA